MVVAHNGYVSLDSGYILKADPREYSGGLWEKENIQR